MKKASSQLIRETAVRCQVPEETVRKIVNGYYKAVSGYMERFSEFKDEWFEYKLNYFGRRKFMALFADLMRKYDVKRQERIVLKKYQKYYKMFLQFLAKKLNLDNH